MNIFSRPKIVVLGMMSRMPVAGNIWLVLHYLEGLRRLGFEPYYVEAHTFYPSMLMEGQSGDSADRAAAFLDRILRRFDLGGRWAYHALHSDGRFLGMSEGRLKRLYRSAALIVNLHGATLPLPEHQATGRLVFLETDPVQLEIECYYHQPKAVAFLAAHNASFTWGENYGSADCKVPLPQGHTIRPTRAPVVLDFWQPHDTTAEAAFTTVGNWRQERPNRDLRFQGEVYTWSKHHEFLKFLQLPARTRQLFELALSHTSHTDADRNLLEANAWRVRDALALSQDLDTYRGYLVRSRGEFTVAKDQNVRLRSGWFSERSAQYLAAGRPVITQETGFSNILPTGRGVIAFSTFEQAAAAVESVASNYEMHCRAATEIAREYFSHDVVLKRLLDEVGLSRPKGFFSRALRGKIFEPEGKLPNGAPNGDPTADAFASPGPASRGVNGHPLAPKDYAAKVQAIFPSELAASDVVEMECTVENLGADHFSSVPPHPVHASYKWLDVDSGLAVAGAEGLRTALAAPLPPREHMTFPIRVQAPPAAGNYLLRVTLVQEQVAWFDQFSEQNYYQGMIRVTAAALNDGAAPADAPGPAAEACTVAAAPTACYPAPADGPVVASPARISANVINGDQPNGVGILGAPVAAKTGVNLIGYLRAESGVGSATRGYAAALQAAGIPTSLHDVSGLQVNRAGAAAPAEIAGEPRHDINLVCADIDLHFAIRSHLGESFFEGRYNIGIWAWELPRFPRNWHDRFAYFDEIWVASSFIADALGPVSPVPVVRVPPALTPSGAGSRAAGRRKLGVRADEFVFLFIFDFHSHFRRKNPVAVIEAFRKAFQPSDPVRLVLKCVNAKSNPRDFDSLRQRAAGFPVTLFSGYWSSQGMRDLMAACDAYVSLHRSEGTGLTVTDAMAAGKPVIATGWSGNMDFMNVSNSFPVRYDMVELEESVGPYRAGERWAEPSIDHAAVMMRVVCEDQVTAAARGRAARRDIRAYYSERAVGELIRRRLETVALRRRLSEFQREVKERFNSYGAMAERVRGCVVRAVPPGAVVAVVSKGDNELVRFDGRTGWHFPRSRKGGYLGHYPVDGTAAVEHVETARERGAEYLVFPGTALWWLEHYADLRQHLNTRYRRVRGDADCVIYALAPQPDQSTRAAR